MEIIIIVGLFVSYAAFVWGICRAFTYFVGKYSDWLEVPWLVVIAASLGMFMPWLTWLVAGYLLFFCKSSVTLMALRAEKVAAITAEEVVEFAEEFVQNNALTNDDWVRQVWSKRSSEDWKQRLSMHPSLLADAVSRNAKIHVSSICLFANWLDIVKHYEYLVERITVDISAR